MAAANPLLQYPIAARVAAHATRGDLQRMRLVSQLWHRVAESELDRRRRCPTAKHGLVAYVLPAGEGGGQQQQGNCRQRLRQSPCKEAVARIFNGLLDELRADWHAPARLLVFSDADFLRASANTTLPPSPLPPGAKKPKRHRHQPECSPSRLPQGTSQDVGNQLHALSSFAAHELPAGCRLHLAVSLTGAIGTGAEAGAAIVEMETAASSDVRPMHGLAHLRVYNSASFGVVSAGEPLPPGAEPKLLLALPSGAGRQFGRGRGLAEEQLLALHPRMIVCAGLCHEFHTVLAGGGDHPSGGVDHSRLVFYGERLRVMSVFVSAEPEVEATLRSLSSQSLQPLVPGYCLAFVFICCAKGSKMYADQVDVETAALRRVFPTVPAIGLFSQGEFGRTCAPGENFAAAVDILGNRGSLSMQGYCTSVCLLSWS